MNVFIWNYINNVSDNYHKEGGVVVIAENIDVAKKLANKEPGCIITDEEPDYICETTDGKENVFIFPDAGCC